MMYKTVIMNGLKTNKRSSLFVIARW